MKDENRKLRSENKNLVMENETLKSCLARLEKKIEDLKEDIKQEVVEDLKRVVIETMKEENQKRERQNNLVIYGVQESTQEIPQERKKEDVKFCKLLFLEGTMVNNVRIEQVIRLGRVQPEDQTGRPRPILVKLAS